MYLRVLFCAILALAGCVSNHNDNFGPDAQASDAATLEADASVRTIWFDGLANGPTFDQDEHPHLSVRVVGFANQVSIWDNGDQIGLALQSQTEEGLFGFDWADRHSVGDHDLQAKAVRPGTDVADESDVVRVVVTGPPTPTPPTVAFDSPTDMQMVTVGSTIDVIVKATDNTVVDEFRLLVGNQDMGFVPATPEGDHWVGKVQWTAAKVGVQMGSVKAYDNEGWGGTALVMFFVVEP